MLERLTIRGCNPILRVLIEGAIALGLEKHDHRAKARCPWIGVVSAPSDFSIVAQPAAVNLAWLYIACLSAFRDMRLGTARTSA